MIMTEHTQSPWIAKGRDIYPANCEADEHLIASCRLCPSESDISARINAAFIVRACNSYEGLLAACQRALSDCKVMVARSERWGVCGHETQLLATADKLREAIAETTGDTTS